MIEFDEDALVCDLAETYHILDYRSLPVQLVATLSVGLRDDSRIKMRAAGAAAPSDIMLLAAIADRIEWLRYGLSSGASKGINKPVSILSTLLGEKQNKSGVKGFRTAEAFEAELARIRGE